MIKLSPSVLSANFMKLGEEIRLLENNGVNYLHLDIMDGVFVPNISIGMPIIKSIRKITNMTIDAHFMIIEPERYINEFINLGCDIINFHFEATKMHFEIIKKVKLSGKKIGMTIKPKTDYKEIIPYLKDLDLVLIMSVEPGFGGQKLIEETLDKVKKIRTYIDDNNLNCEVEIDGGIKLENVENAIKAGANVIVVGSDIFENNDKEKILSKYNNIFNKYI